MDDLDRYREQIRAWRAEQARLAARSWWRKALDGVRDFAMLHRWAIGLTMAAFGLALGAATLALVIAWLASW